MQRRVAHDAGKLGLCGSSLGVAVKPPAFAVAAPPVATTSVATLAGHPRRTPESFRRPRAPAATAANVRDAAVFLAGVLLGVCLVVAALALGALWQVPRELRRSPRESRQSPQGLRQLSLAPI